LSFIRGRLREAVAVRGISLRSLAKRVGLKSHMPVSRFLQGRTGISLSLLSRIVQVLDLSEPDLDVMIARLWPPPPRTGLQRSTKFPPEVAKYAQVAKVTREAMPYDYMPIIYEVLRQNGGATPERLHGRLQADLELSVGDVRNALEALRNIGLAHESGGAWALNEPDAHIVAPGKTRAKAWTQLARYLTVRHAKLNETQPAEMIHKISIVSLPGQTPAEAMAAFTSVYRRFFHELMLMHQPSNSQVATVVLSMAPVTRAADEALS
jgi:transcriptional regulator with XRE-family HTH domain